MLEREIFCGNDRLKYALLGLIAFLKFNEDIKLTKIAKLTCSVFKTEYLMNE